MSSPAKPPRAPRGRAGKAPKLADSTAAPLLPDSAAVKALAKQYDPDPIATFVLDPDAQMVVGASMNRVAGRTHLFIALGAILVALLSALLALVQLEVGTRNNIELNRRAVTTSATIVARRMQDMGREALNRWFVTYQFSVPAPAGEPAPFSREMDVDRSLYQRWSEGTSILIKYLPDEPARSTLAHLELAPVEIDLLIIILFGPGIIATIVVVWALWVALSQSRYQRLGRVIRGEIITCTGVELQGHFRVTVRYKFRTPDNRTLYGRLTRTRDDLRTKELPKQGDPIAVLFVGNRLFRLL